MVLFQSLLFLSLIYLSYCGCPSGFQLVAAGQCRGIGQLSIVSQSANGAYDAIRVCGEKNANPVIIHNQEQQDYWVAKVAENIVFILGAVCNQTSHLFQWADGSPIDYYPPRYNSAFNHDCPEYNVTWEVGYGTGGFWDYGKATSDWLFDIYCTHDLPRQVPMSDNCLEDTCYEIANAPANLSEAHIICKSLDAEVVSVHSAKENSFIRRLAVSRGYVNGIWLGAVLSGKSDNYSWIDGSSWDFINFGSGFPNTAFGECLGMDTVDTAGDWINVDCSTPLPFVCARNKNAPPRCRGASVKPGDLIMSPGYPADASTPCDYFLTVDAGKRVEVQINVLEANTCCDHLILYEGTLGGTLIVDLTGEHSNLTYRTTTSNIMHVPWLPKDGKNVRGMMITYKAI